MVTTVDNFDEELKKLSPDLKELIINEHGFNQKLENLSDSLQSLTFGFYFNQKLQVTTSIDVKFLYAI